MSSVEVEVDWTELTALTNLDKKILRRQGLKLFAIDHYGHECPEILDQAADTQQSEVTSLKQSLVEMQHRHHARHKLWEVEKKLLSRALAVAKKRFNGENKRTTLTSTNTGQHNSTLGGYLREEIAAQYLQVEKNPEGIQRTVEQSHAMPEESVPVPSDLSKQPEKIESIRQQLEKSSVHASNERLRLESELNASRNEDTEAGTGEHQQISSLQQSLHDTQDALNLSRSQHAHALAEQQQLESDLQASLAEAERSIEEVQQHANTQIDTLRKQIEVLESTQKQLFLEKSQLADSLKAETRRAKEYAQRAQGLDENVSSLKAKLEAQQHVLEDAATQHQTDMALQMQELEQALRTIEELVTARKQQDDALRLADTKLKSHLARERELQTVLADSQHRAKQDIAALNSELDQRNQSHAELQQTLHETHAQLAQVQAERQQQISNLESSLEQTQRSASERLASSKSKIASLYEQIQFHESSLQQLTDEKEKLANCLQIESSHVNVFAKRAESLDEQRRQLECELKTTRQDFDEIEAKQACEITSLSQELKLLQETNKRLDYTVQQLSDELEKAESDYQAERERLNRALDTEKLQHKRNRDRIRKVIEKHKEKIETIRSKAIRQHKRRLQAEALLAQEQENSKHLKSLIRTTQGKMEISNKRIEELEQDQKMLEDDLQKKIKTAQEAWDKASLSDIALKTTKHELSALKDDTEREIDYLQAQLELHEERRLAIQNSHDAEISELQKSLDDYKTSLISAQTTIRALKSDRQSVSEAKSRADKKFAELEQSAYEIQSELTSSLESSRQEVIYLRQELAETKQQMSDPVEVEQLNQVLQKAKEEGEQLKRKVAGLSEVMLEMERQQNRNQDTEITKLRAALISAEQKQQKSDELAHQIDPLKRQLAVQELAIEMLSDDLESATRAKESLLQERNKLHNELSAIREQTIQ